MNKGSSALTYHRYGGPFTMGETGSRSVPVYVDVWNVGVLVVELPQRRHTIWQPRQVLWPLQMRLDGSQQTWWPGKAAVEDASGGHNSQVACTVRA